MTNGLADREIGRSLGTISSWIADKVSTMNYGMIQIELQVQKGEVVMVNRVVREQIKQ